MAHPPARPPGYLGITRRPSPREWRRAILLFVVGIGGLFLVMVFVHPQASLLPVGAPAPAVSLDAAAGGHVAVPTGSSAAPFVLEFFEANCSHCQDAASHLCNQKVPVYAVDAAKDSAETVNAYRAKYAPGCNYPLLLDPTLAVARAYAVTAVPTVYVVKGGRVVFASTGVDGVNGVAAAVTKALGG